MWSYPRDQPKAHMASVGKLACGWPRLNTPNQKHELQDFPSLVTISMQKVLACFIQRY